jgi:hypothetical protein
MEARLSEEDLTKACADYTQITGDPVLRERKRHLVAAARRVHGTDFGPYVQTLFEANGSAVNLLGQLRLLPPRLAAGRESPAPTGRGRSDARPDVSISKATAPSETEPPSAETHPANEPTVAPIRAKQAGSADSIWTGWTAEDMAEVDREFNAGAPDLLDQEPAAAPPDDLTVGAVATPAKQGDPRGSDETTELAWRVEAMRPQVPAEGRPIPPLVARPDHLFDHDLCVSCGEPLWDVRPYCRLCLQAAKVVLGTDP